MPRGQSELYLAKSVCRDGKKSWSTEVYILAASLWSPDEVRTQNDDKCGGRESRSRDSKSRTKVGRRGSSKRVQIPWDEGCLIYQKLGGRENKKEVWLADKSSGGTVEEQIWGRLGRLCNGAKTCSAVGS